MTAATAAAAANGTSREHSRAPYLNALHAFAATVRRQGLDERLLETLWALNSAYYLAAYLSDEQHLAAVDAAARRLVTTAGGLQRRRRSRSVQTTTTARSAPAAGSQLLTALDRAASDSRLVVAAQHLLEIAPELEATDRHAVPRALRQRLVAAQPTPAFDAALAAARADGLPRWAACNARPARAGETEWWARCLRRQPLRSLQQALASGLRFSALLDALTLAATRTVPPLDPAPHPLILAHAVRRLTEIGERPALGPWLGAAMTLGGRTAPPAAAAEPIRTPAELARAAVDSGEGGRVQLAEAALMEYEALPSNLRDAVLAALERETARPPTPNTGGASNGHTNNKEKWT
ncbi:MAG: hypothetical protein ACYDCQ_16755 [Dehalococcoidia bacterium]